MGNSGIKVKAILWVIILISVVAFAFAALNFLEATKGLRGMTSYQIEVTNCVDASVEEYTVVAPTGCKFIIGVHERAVPVLAYKNGNDWEHDTEVINVCKFKILDSTPIKD